jgi:hypothetical protein
MLTRCKNPKSRAFGAYGGRGIRICDKWLNFEAFLSDMGPRPSLQHSIERTDVNGNYEPGNCAWILRSLQGRNRRNSVALTIDGITKNRIEWCIQYGVPLGTLRSRLGLGWDAKRALETPTLRKGRARADAYPLNPRSR